MPAPDYQKLIDAETWAFIHRTAEAYPEDAAERSIDEQRAVYDAMCRLFFQGYPAGLAVRDAPVAGVPCRHYGEAEGKPVVLYLHGGGFVVGGLHSHDDVCAEIAHRTGLRVVSADYRLSPEHRHPAALDDTLAVARALRTAGHRLILAGDSAGGNLAAAADRRLRHEAGPSILGQVLIYPGLGGDRTRGSYLTHAHAPMLTTADVVFYSGIRHGGVEPGPDPSVSPLQDQDFSGLPPTLAIAAECDPLADDAHAYAAAITAAGGRAQAITETGLVHGYLRARSTSARAARSFDRIIATISAMASGTWTGGPP